MSATASPSATASETVPATGRRPLRGWISDRPRGELVLWIGLLAIALGLRLYDLGARPFHHDESQDAYFSWVFFDHGDYHYQPILHGPLRFYLTALNYVLFGDSNFTARLAPALMGTAVVGLPYLLRRQIGRGAALAAGVAFAIGPTYLYFSRFAREDIYIAALNLALIVAIFRFLARPRAGGPTIIAVILALAFATKETTFITSGLLALFFAGGVVVQTLATKDWRKAPIVRAITSVGWVPWAYAFAAFWIVFTLLFTVGMTHPDGLWAGMYKGLKYWAGQQKVGRGGEPWYFYEAVLFGEEWPILILAVIGTFFALRRPTLLRAFLVYFTVASLAVYAHASEKFAWLAMHPLMPMILLAGIGVQGLWVERGRVARAAGAVLAVVALAYGAYASFLVNAEHRANPRELLVSTQSSEDVVRQVDRVFALDRRYFATRHQHLTITIDSGQGATFPYAWYFRHQPVGYIDMTTPNYVPNTQVLIMTDQGRDKLRPVLTAYDGRQFDFRVWWVRDWSKKFSASAWWGYLAHRRPWNPTGGMKEWIYIRRDVA